MRKWILLMVVALLIVNSIFLLEYLISSADRCNLSCVDKGFSFGSCTKVSLAQRPCEGIGLVTDNTYDLYCKDDNREVCCCKR